MTSTAGLVLAAGAGRRMGGPKALLRPSAEGPTLLESAVERVRAAGCDDVLVVVGAAADEVAALAAAAGAAVVRAADWDEGMGASLRAGLAALAGRPSAPERVLVTLVDLPDVGADVMARVLAAAGGPGALARAAYGGVPGHPVVLGRDHWEAVSGTAIGDRGARDHLRATAHVLVECGDLATGRDVDTVDDLA
ncbi:NTP transferase domain-containing protein [Oryzobacter terrae]|uniref:nucleotidyltransferase family protein n=1 Tax=Oryzobacter terrae TaxID=1620385 RepID=UPI00366B9F09